MPELPARARDYDARLVPLREDRRSRAPEVDDARVVPRDAVLVRVSRVVLLRDEVTEEAVGERLVPVRVDARHVDRDRVVLADVLGERLAGLAVEHDDAHHALEAEEEVVLSALVVVQRANHTLPRPSEIRLAHGLRQRARPHQLHEEPALVVETAQRNARDQRHHLLAPVSSIRRPTSARSPQCLPPSCHQPSTRRTSRSPRWA